MTDNQKRAAEVRHGDPRVNSCRVCGRKRRWFRHISSLSGRCAKCVARGLR